MIFKTLKLLFSHGDVVEMRIPKANGNKTYSGYFNDFEKLADAASKYNGSVSGIYVTLNPAKPELLARASNRVNTEAITTTQDIEIKKRIWLPIDIDPIRPAGISSTDDEHKNAIAKAYYIKKFLSKRGWAEPIIGDSGNGASALYRIDLPNTEENTELIKNCLDAFDFLFTDESTEIDTSVFNAARIWKLYGTVAKKGDNTQERPHRQSAILEVPTETKTITVDQIKEIIAIVPKEPEEHQNQKGYNGFDVEAWMKQYDLTIAKTKSWRGGTLYVLEQCPFDSNHKYPDACVIKAKSGALGFHCFHNSCSNHDWKALRNLKEPTRGKLKQDYKNEKKPTNNDILMEAVKSLDSVCDGAKKSDGEGFNKFDADFVKSVLEQGYPPTHNQKLSLHKLLKKYSVQLSGMGINYNNIPAPSEPKKIDSKKTSENEEGKISYGEIATEILRKYPIITLRDNPDEMYFYENGVYRYGAQVVIRELAQTILEEKTSKYTINEIIFFIQNETFIERAKINTEKNLINLQNGLYNLQTNTVEPHTPNIISTCQIPIEYKPDAQCPEIANFLCEILRPKDIALILQLFGYCLTPDYSIQKAFLWNGRGANGKGTVGRLLYKFIGESNHCGESLTSLNEDKYSVANLYGKLVNVDTDLKAKTITDDTIFKKLTGGDRIMGERKYQNKFEFYNTTRLVFGANDIPQHPKGGLPWNRRLIMIDFPVRFDASTEDKNLDEKLQTPKELSGLLNIAIDCLKWLLIDKNFYYHKSPEEVGEEYLLKSNSVMSFMSEMTEASDDSAKTSDLYQAYVSWGKAKKINKIEKINVFGKALRNGGYVPIRPLIEGKQVQSYEGISINYKKINELVGLRDKNPTNFSDFDNQDAYKHWFIKKNTISRVSRVDFTMYIRKIIELYNRKCV